MAFAAPDQSQVVPGQPNNQQAQNAPIAAGGAGIGGSSKAPNTPGQNVPAQPSAQLSAYLSANQPQAAAMAGNIANTVGGQVQAAGQAILPAVNTYTGNLYNVPTDTGVNQAVTQSPASLTPDQQATYETELGAAAKVPNSANTFETTQPYQDLTPQIQSAVNTANLWDVGNDVAQLSTALQPFESPNSTTGNVTLDSLLLSQVPGAYSQIQSAVAPAANLQGYLTQQAGTADAALQAAIAQDQAATQAAQGAGNTYVQNLTDSLNQQVAADQATAGNLNAQVLADLKSQNLTPADLATLGVDPEQWSALQNEIQLELHPATVYSQATPGQSFPTASGQYQATPVAVPVDLDSYLTQQGPAGAITAANVASTQNYADLAALQELMGTAAPQNVPLQAANASQAGTVPSNLNSFDYSTAMNTISGDHAAAVAAAQAWANQMQLGSDANHAADVAEEAAQQAELEWNLSNPASIPASEFLPSGIQKYIPGSPGSWGVSIPASSATDAATTTGNVSTGISTWGPAISNGVNNAGSAISSGVHDAGNDIVNTVSCFVADTPIEMADNTVKRIQDIRVGDMTKGGKVTFTTQGTSADLWDYNGEVVTGGHYVKESDKWTDVAHSEKGFKLKREEVPVYDFCTDKHSIWINGIEFSDAITMVFFDLAYTKGEKTLAHQYLEKLLSKVPVGA